MISCLLKLSKVTEYIPMLPQSVVNTEGRYTMLLAWEIVIVTFRFQVFLYGITQVLGRKPEANAE